MFPTHCPTKSRAGGVRLNGLCPPHSDSNRLARPAPQSNVTTLLAFLPPTDGLVANLQSTTDVAIVEVLVEQLHRLDPTLFECLKTVLRCTRGRGFVGSGIRCHAPIAGNY